jgi:hypothetical protein
MTGDLRSRSYHVQVRGWWLRTVEPMRANEELVELIEGILGERDELRPTVRWRRVLREK